MMGMVASAPHNAAALSAPALGQQVAEFSKRLDHLAKMDSGPVLEAEIKKVQVDLSNLSISTVAKAEFQDRISKIHKKVMDDLQAEQKVESISNKAIDTCGHSVLRGEQRQHVQGRQDSDLSEAKDKARQAWVHPGDSNGAAADPSFLDGARGSGVTALRVLVFHSRLPQISRLTC
jgi:hypothetical protein